MNVFAQCRSKDATERFDDMPRNKNRKAIKSLELLLLLTPTRPVYIQELIRDIYSVEMSEMDDKTFRKMRDLIRDTMKHGWEIIQIKPNYYVLSDNHYIILSQSTNGEIPPWSKLPTPEKLMMIIEEFHNKIFQYEV
tara:strand:- start:45 stop:455 length:411 start_codon:yes stop_codon:yes gene_type:complete